MELNLERFVLHDILSHPKSIKAPSFDVSPLSLAKSPSKWSTNPEITTKINAKNGELYFGNNLEIDDYVVLIKS